MFASLLLLSSISLVLAADANLPDPNALACPAPATPTSNLLIYRQDADHDSGSRESIELLRKLALANLESGRKTEAISVCSELLDIQAFRTRVTSCALDVANAAYNCGDYATARAIYTLVSKKGQSENGLLTAQEGLTKITVANGDDAAANAAIDNFCQEFKNHPKAPHAVLRVAQSAERRGLMSKADEVCQRVIARWPQSGAAIEAREMTVMHDLSTCDEKTGAEKVRAIIAENTTASRRIGKAAGDMYFGQRKYAAAGEIYSSLSQSDSDDEYVLAAFGAMIRTNIKLGNTAEADTMLQTLRSRFVGNPNLAGEIAGMADEYVYSGKKTKAVPIYDYVGKTWPATPEGGRSVLRLNTKDAGTEQDFAAQLDAGLVSLEREGVAEESMVRFVESIQAEAMEKMAEGKEAEAREIASKAAKGWQIVLQRRPDEDRAAILYSAGQSCMVADQPKQAAEYFAQCAEELPLSQYAASAQFMVGECYRSLLERKAIDETEGENKMIKAYRKVLQNYPGGPMAKGATARLAIDTEIAKGGTR